MPFRVQEFRFLPSFYNAQSLDYNGGLAKARSALFPHVTVRIMFLRIINAGETSETLEHEREKLGTFFYY